MKPTNNNQQVEPDISSAFDEAFSKWWESEETQRRFHCCHYSEGEIAYAAAVFGKDWGQDNPYSD